jgi:hypothetical protein
MPPVDLTIRFFGLCLFTQTMGRGPVTVYLAQPAGMPHLSLLRYYKGGNKWAAQPIPPGSDLTYGTTGDVKMPPVELMSDVGKMPRDPKATLKAKAQLDATAGLTKVTLNGGALRVKGRVGIWKQSSGAAGEYYFPYRVEWSGAVGLNQPHGIFDIWNSLSTESPDVGDDSPFPTRMPTEDEAKEHSAMHFKAYYQLLTGTNGVPVEWTKKSMPSPDGDPTEELTAGPMDALKRLLGLLEPRGMIVSSCPSAQVQLA